MHATARPLLILLVAFACAGPASAQTRNRLAVAIDSGAGMLQSPERLTFAESCASSGFNPCGATNVNPSLAQEACNACVRDTIRSDSGCASAWDSTCVRAYRACLAAVTGQETCSATMSTDSAVATRGDGSLEIPGCDLDANGTTDDSRLFQAKTVVRAAATAVPGVEVALWRYAQVTGGQVCAGDAACPDTPGGASVLTCESYAGANRCVFDADLLDGPTTAGFEGQCSPFTHTGSPASFTCNACDFTTSYDRANCELFDLDQVRSGGTSPLGAAAVQCLPMADPTHRYVTYHGATTSTCDPSGGDRLVDFPPDAGSSNLAAIDAWLDHAQTDPAADVEVRANGGSPVAALLRDQRDALLATLSADASARCRRYAVALVLDGPDNCEANAASVAAAAALQSLTFTPPGGGAVSGYAVPVHVLAFGACPASAPECADVQALDAIAAAGGTVAAVRAGTEQELAMALAGLAESLDQDTCVDAVFADSFE